MSGRIWATHPGPPDRPIVVDRWRVRVPKGDPKTLAALCTLVFAGRYVRTCAPAPSARRFYGRLFYIIIFDLKCSNNARSLVRVRVERATKVTINILCAGGRRLPNVRLAKFQRCANLSMS